MTTNEAKNLLIVRIERSDNNYSAYLESIDGIAVTGKTIDQIKSKMSKAISLFVEECNALKGEIPEELKGDYELIFKKRTPLHSTLQI